MERERKRETQIERQSQRETDSECIALKEFEKEGAKEKEKKENTLYLEAHVDCAEEHELGVEQLNDRVPLGRDVRAGHTGVMNLKKNSLIYEDDFLGCCSLPW